MLPDDIAEYPFLFKNSVTMLTNDVLPFVPVTAKILVGLDNALFVATKIIEKKLSVRQAENFVKLFKKKYTKNTNTKDPNIKKIESDLMEKLGLKTQISNKKNNKVFI